MFRETVVPRLIQQPKWFKIDQDLKEKDIVYFEKRESALGSTWTVGEVDQVIVGRDGLVRRAIIKYFNASENNPEKGKYHPQFTDRAVRSLVKLWSIDDTCLFDDLAELQGRIDVAGGQEEAAGTEQGGDAHSAVQAGACQGAVAWYVASTMSSQVYIDENGCLIDLSPYTSSCEVFSVPVEKIKENHERDCVEVTNETSCMEMINGMDTLYKVMVSTKLNFNDVGQQGLYWEEKFPECITII